MATLEDKILGEKRENYCSSSEGEQEDSDNEETPNENLAQGSSQQNINEWNGTCSNTGPKGVLNDWKQYKIHQTLLKEEKNIQKLQQIQKLTLVCQSKTYNEEEERKKKEEHNGDQEEDEIDKEMRELENDDDFLFEYQKEKMKQMYENIINKQTKIFGKLINITSSDQYLHEIDSESNDITIILHLSSDLNIYCNYLNQQLSELSTIYKNYKFCNFSIDNIENKNNLLSLKFQSSALPTIIIYKNQQVVISFVQFQKQFGNNSYHIEELERFFIEHSILYDRKLLPKIITKTELNNYDDDSD